MNKIGILTSGGDSPGMNSAVRAVVRKGIFHNLKVCGIKRGFHGLIQNDIAEMTLGSVADIIHRGGTILRTARSEEFKTKEGQLKAVNNLKNHGIEGLIVAGGDGSFRGANDLSKYGIKVIGLPATIDNDIPFTDYSIGFDTAVNTAIDAINKIRDTATSHERTFIIEVMGRDSGSLALEAGLAGGAESILLPEITFDMEKVCNKLIKGYKRGKLHSIILVAEGAASGYKVSEIIKDKTGFDTRIIVLGHLQRGGSPTAIDRNLASRYGAKAVDLLMDGISNKMIGIDGTKLIVTEISEAVNNEKKIDLDLYELANILSI